MHDGEAPAADLQPQLNLHQHTLSTTQVEQCFCLPQNRRHDEDTIAYLIVPHNLQTSCLQLHN